MSEQKCEIGLIGLGTMGHNLVMNMADHGFAVAGYNRDPSRVDALLAAAEGRDIRGAKSFDVFVELLRDPCAIMMLVPAGKPVDGVIEQLLPLLKPGAVLIDGGNSYFQDTERRIKELAEKGIHFIGMGVSGGAEGARYGPSLMPGGPAEAYERVRPVFEAIAAKVHGEPCITYLGSGPAGHYVKMVHNGIEYGLMQLLAESYDLMKRGLGLSNDELHTIYQEWNEGELNAFLVEITADIFTREDELSGGRLVDQILDAARQKGTGKWTSEEALKLGVPTPSIDVAVTGRYLSALKEERVAASQVLPRPAAFDGDRETAVGQLRQATYVAMIVTYAQGLALLREASQTYGYSLDLEGVARIWRGGCIIRAAMLEEFRRAYLARPELPNLLLDPDLAMAMREREGDLRATVQRAAGLAIPAPGFMAALAYLDSYRSERLPANLIQAQRDYFGAHTYERVDREGTFHTEWGAMSAVG
ncbi:MAG: NADP-dependent phosphogluconate dehydrogenase [Chloroflexi bacterium]|nr:NADP-dependent phosphogluconate dehydrogenase [Chloroflexota bacterium]MCI0580409.1 NADP-dependent phosphogluconate dehydrogenase [Chloroflexota bacterium]MCI0650180.1 NADP-dependent phosphogluconate dehydrogenase [Chloroflexota bacterium]MCI0729509.1 NADP-dependent phosphogluconate dehydrogenase [Chloroflexota bacterium]